MAYFPNGSSGDIYMEQYCENCWNLRDLNDGRGPGCPIWDWHTLKSYEQVVLPHQTKKEKIIAKFYHESLEHFIPSDDKGNPKECLMFLPKNLVDVQGQMKLFGEDNGKV